MLFRETVAVYCENHRERGQRERERSGNVVRDATFRVSKKKIYISGLEGSQVVPARPSGRGRAFNRN
jgi:hypothetical protein